MSHWNSAEYDGNHSYVSQYGESLIDSLAAKPDEFICDLGCGTGDLTHKISESGCRVIGIDNAASMIAEARRKYPNIQFEIQDIASLASESQPYQFDAIFSNAAMHWVTEQEHALKEIWTALQSHGRFICEMGGWHNIHHILNAIYHALDAFGYPQNKNNMPWYFPHSEEYSDLLEQQGFHVLELQHYERPTKLNAGEAGLRNWISMFASCFFQQIPDAVYQRMLIFIEQKLKPVLFSGGHWHADYKRLRIQAEKI